ASRMVVASRSENDRPGGTGTHPFGWAPGAGWPGSGLRDQALAHGSRRRLGAALRVELVEDVPQVELHRVLGQPEAAGDLPVGEAADDTPQDVELSVGELVRVPGPRGRRRPLAAPGKLGEDAGGDRRG